MATTQSSSKPLLESYFDLRLTMGLLGFLLPLSLLAIAQELRPSMSDYYASDARDVFVGILFAIAGFLGAYRGYQRVDDLAGKLAGVCAVVVAVCPSTSTNVTHRYVHVSAAGLLFLTFAFFCVFLFTKRDPKVPATVPVTGKKRWRNLVYRVCGGVIVAGLLAIFCFSEPTQPKRDTYFILVVEWIMLWAFALAWVVKGNALLKDEGESAIRTIRRTNP